MNNNLYIVLIALAGYLTLFFSLIPFVESQKKRTAEIQLIRVIGTFIFLAGILAGWYKSSSIIFGFVLPTIGYLIFIGVVEFLLRKQRLTS